MATLSVSGIDALSLSMQEISEIPEGIISNILNTQADIGEAAIVAKGKSYGVHRTGETLKHIKKGKIKRDRDGNPCIFVSFNGKNKEGIRYAEIAFINNYGKTGQAPRPFVTDGVASVEKRAGDIASKIYDDWLKTKNL